MNPPCKKCKYYFEETFGHNLMPYKWCVLEKPGTYKPNMILISAARGSTVFCGTSGRRFEPKHKSSYNFWEALEH